MTQEPLAEISGSDGGGESIAQDQSPDQTPQETTPEDAKAITLQNHALGSFRLSVTKEGMQIARGDGTILLSGATGESAALPAPLAWRQGVPAIKELLGSYVFEEEVPAWTVAKAIEALSATDKAVTLRAGAATATIELVKPGVLRVHWKLPQASGNRLLQSFACRTEDRFFGGGARVHGTEHRGEILPNWVSEQGIGKLRRTTPSQGFPLKGGIHDTYLPVPFVMTQQGFGLLIENSQRSLFHLCPKGDEGRWSVEVWHHELRYLVLDGPSPLGVIEQLTSITGRPKLAPKWAFAPWLDATHGQQKVLDTAKKLRKEKIPTSVIWTEDWVGAFEDARGYHLHYQWNGDTTLYPDFKGMTGQLHDMGFKFLGYFNPFLRDGSPQWKEAHDNDYAIKDADGKIVYFVGVFGKQTTLPDLTKPAVRDWVIGYMKAAVALGFDGWMADYAEWLPIASKLSDGTDGMTSHNLYPLMWQEVNRTALDAARPDGDYVFFARSGWAGAGGLAPVFWAGDQQTTFDDNDGLQTVIPLCIDAGISGIPIMGHDIAGYSSVGVPTTTKELFYRWTQLGAFSAIMRTHHGSYADQNWNWQKDTDTIAMFKQYAELHVGLFPYRYTIAKEAADKGWPMMRHLFLHYPDDPKTYQIKDQFMLGPGLLIAPVVEDQARERKVYLPGKLPWFAFATGKRYAGQETHTIPASLEEIPVFAPAGAIIPTILPVPESQQAGVDTLAPAKENGLLDIKDAETRTLVVRIYLGAKGQWEQYDGSLYKLQHHTAISDSTKVTIQIGGKLWPPCAQGVLSACWKPQGENGALVLIEANKSVSLDVLFAGTKASTIEISTLPVSREFALLLHW